MHQTHHVSSGIIPNTQLFTAGEINRNTASQHTPPCAFDFPHLIEFYFVTGLGSSSIEINCTMFLVCCDSLFYFSPLTDSSWSTQSLKKTKYTCNDTQAEYESRLKARFEVVLCSYCTALAFVYFICIYRQNSAHFTMLKKINVKSHAGSAVKNIIKYINKPINCMNHLLLFFFFQKQPFQFWQQMKPGYKKI